MVCISWCVSEDNFGCWFSSSIVFESGLFVCPCIGQASWPFELPRTLLPSFPVILWEHGDYTCCCCAQFYVCSGDPNPGLHSYATRTLSTELSLQSHINSFFMHSAITTVHLQDFPHWNFVLIRQQHLLLSSLGSPLDQLCFLPSITDFETTCKPCVLKHL